MGVNGEREFIVTCKRIRVREQWKGSSQEKGKKKRAQDGTSQEKINKRVWGSTKVEKE